LKGDIGNSSADALPLLSLQSKDNLIMRLLGYFVNSYWGNQIGKEGMGYNTKLMHQKREVASHQIPDI
jgi:hypothetical protein